MERKRVREMGLMAIAACILLFLLEQTFAVSYIAKTAGKAILFFIVPLLYIKFKLKKQILHFLNIRNVDLQRLKLGFYFGLTAAAVIFITFFLLKGFIQTDLIVADLRERLKITPQTYVFVALYITFGNSLLEEFFFRGFIFLQLNQKGNRMFAYLFSSLLFAIYHVAIFATWFNGYLILLAILGLTVAGILFNWLNTKSNNFLNSWICHMLADISIVMIGFYLFFT